MEQLETATAPNLQPTVYCATEHRDLEKNLKWTFNKHQLLVIT